MQRQRGGTVDHHHVIVAQQVVVVLIQLYGAEETLVFLQRLLGDQCLQRDGREEGGGADAGDKPHRGHTVLQRVEHTDVHFLRLVDLVGEHHVGDGVVCLHLAGEKVLAAIRVGEGGHAHVQRDLDALVVGGVGEAEEGAHHLADASVVVVHIRQRLVEVVVLRQGGLGAENRRLVVDEALQVDVKCLRDLVERFDVDGDGTVFVFGERRLAFVDHGGKLLDGIAAAFAVFFDALSHKVGERTHVQHLPARLGRNLFSCEDNTKRLVTCQWFFSV